MSKNPAWVYRQSPELRADRKDTLRKAVERFDVARRLHTVDLAMEMGSGNRELVRRAVQSWGELDQAMTDLRDALAEFGL